MALQVRRYVAYFLDHCFAVSSNFFRSFLYIGRDQRVICQPREAGILLALNSSIPGLGSANKLQMDIVSAGLH